MRVTALLRAERVEFTGSRGTKGWISAVRDCADLGEQGGCVVNQLLDEIVPLQSRIDQTEVRLERLTEHDAFVTALRAMSGIGLVTAVTRRAELGTMSRFRSGKQTARFCGRTPRNASSGLKQADAGLIRAGNNALRAVLIETAHRLMRDDPRWSTLSRSLRTRGKPGSVTAAAVANRWVRWLYHQLLPLAA